MSKYQKILSALKALEERAFRDHCADKRSLIRLAQWRAMSRAYTHAALAAGIIR